MVERMARYSIASGGRGSAELPVVTRRRPRERDAWRGGDELREQEALLVEAVELLRQRRQAFAQRAAQDVGQQRVLADGAREDVARQEGRGATATSCARRWTEGGAARARKEGGK